MTYHYYNFEVQGGFDIELDGERRMASDNGRFWAKVRARNEALPDACGCYVFCMRNKDLVPWYVGKTERRTFETECFRPGTREVYNLVLAKIKQGTPLLFLLPRLNGAGDKYSKPDSRRLREVDDLKTRLIAIAFKRNPELLNIGTTAFLSQMVVPGIVNGAKGNSKQAVDALRIALGLSG